MIEMLKLLGFEAQEIDAELPRVTKVFNKLGITAADIERGKRRLHKYYDMEIKGVGKVFGFYLRELTDTVMAREEGKKVIYAFMAPYINFIGSAAMTKSKEVHISIQPWDSQIVLGIIFDKIVPVLEAAEKKWLKAGVVGHCGNVKTFLGLIALNLIPRPDLVLTTGFLCETAPKTADLLHEFYGLPVFCCDTCFDREIGEYAEGSKRITALAAASMRNLTRKIEDTVGFEITDDMLSEVLDVHSRFDSTMDRLRDIIAYSDPMPISSTHEIIWQCLGMLTDSLEKKAEITDTLNTICEELQERVNKGVGVMPKGAPRIMAMLPAHYTDPRLEYLAGELGLAIVTSDGNFNVPFEETSNDPYIRMLNYFQDSIISVLAKRIPLIIEACKRLNIDGVLDRFHAPCRTVAGDALIIQEAVKKELGIPALLMEWENFDPRAYNHEEYKRRLEAFKTMLETRANRH
jgi:benzoyl-CoA reductase/2-hydroxyglutaryl-CoA dehydratase subunit BcrC/BadD/HgdB